MKLLVLPMVLCVSLVAWARVKNPDPNRLQTESCSIAGLHVLNLGAEDVGAIDNGTMDPDRTIKVALKPNVLDAELVMAIISSAPISSSDYNDHCYIGTLYNETLGLSVVSISPPAQAFLKIQAGDNLLLNCHGEDLSLPSPGCNMQTRQ